MECDLRIGGAVAGLGRRDCLRLADPIDLYDPGHDMPARGLPDEAAGKAARESERTEEGKPPIFRLDAGRADPVIPGLRRTLVRGRRFGGLAVADAGASKQIGRASCRERMFQYV